MNGSEYRKVEQIKAIHAMNFWGYLAALVIILDLLCWIGTFMFDDLQVVLVAIIGSILAVVCCLRVMVFFRIVGDLEKEGE